MNIEELVKLQNDGLNLNVAVGIYADTVWLTQEDMGLLFEKNK